MKFFFVNFSWICMVYQNIKINPSFDLFFQILSKISIGAEISQDLIQDLDLKFLLIFSFLFRTFQENKVKLSLSTLENLIKSVTNNEDSLENVVSRILGVVHDDNLFKRYLPNLFLFISNRQNWFFLNFSQFVIFILLCIQNDDEIEWFCMYKYSLFAFFMLSLFQFQLILSIYLFKHLS